MFTPEAFLDIAVAISGLPHALEVNIAPDATVGDLKSQVQSQLNAANDPHQLLVLNDNVLSNSSRLRSVCNNYAKCTRDALLQRRYLASRSCVFFFCRVETAAECLSTQVLENYFLSYPFLAENSLRVW